MTLSIGPTESDKVLGRRFVAFLGKHKGDRDERQCRLKEEKVKVSAVDVLLPFSLAAFSCDYPQIKSFTEWRTVQYINKLSHLKRHFNGPMGQSTECGKQGERLSVD